MEILLQAPQINKIMESSTERLINKVYRYLDALQKSNLYLGLKRLCATQQSRTKSCEICISGNQLLE